VNCPFLEIRTSSELQLSETLHLKNLKFTANAEKSSDKNDTCKQQLSEFLRVTLVKLITQKLY